MSISAKGVKSPVLTGTEIKARLKATGATGFSLVCLENDGRLIRECIDGVEYA